MLALKYFLNFLSTKLKFIDVFSYLNMFRPPEKVRREVERKRLELLVNQSFNESEQINGEYTLKKPDYPDMFYQYNRKNMPVWQHNELIQQNTGEGKYAKLYGDFINPAEQHVLLDESKNDSK